MLVDDEFFGMKMGTQPSEKAVSTINTASSISEAPQEHEGELPEEILKVEDQTVSEILSLNSNKLPTQNEAVTDQIVSANSRPLSKAKVVNKFYDRNGSLKAPDIKDVPVF